MKNNDDMDGLTKKRRAPSNGAELEKESEKKSKKIQKSLDDIALGNKGIGYKAANLELLKNICKPYGADVPPFYAISNDVIQEYLRQYAPGLDEEWQSFVQAQGGEKGFLTEGAKQCLARIRELIAKSFEKNPLFDMQACIFLQDIKVGGQDVTLMVRSTGMEDRADLANPGGNESVAGITPDINEISQKGIAIVVASYFSEKSMMQRLLGRDDISQKPIMPVLLQEMIGQSDDAIPVSGVMYSDAHSTKIQMAPGHGTYIVNSRGPSFDSYDVTEQGVVYAAIMVKERRLTPNSRGEMEWQDNTPALRDSSSIPLEQVYDLSQIGRKIADYYGQNMDIEFVCKNGKLYIVQARPIPEGDARLLSSSTIAPDKVSFIKDNYTVYSGQTISPAGLAAKVVSSSAELLVCHDIGEALDKYLNPEKNNLKVGELQAVVIMSPAPLTSHEAAQFNAKGITVVQLNDKDYQDLKAKS